VTPTSSRAASGDLRVTATSTTSDDDARQQRSSASAAASVVVVGQMSQDELRRKTKSIVDEYLHLNDLKVRVLAGWPSASMGALGVASLVKISGNCLVL